MSAVQDRSADPGIRTTPRGDLARRTLWRPSMIFLIGLVVFGLFVPQLFPSQVPLLVSILSVLIFAYAWNPVGGVLGELSLIHVAFWGGGAYAAVLSVNAGHPVVVCALMAVGVGVGLAIIFSEFIFLSRVSGLYLTVLTLVAVYFVQAIVLNSQYLGGDAGLTAIQLPLSFNTVYYVSVVFAALLIVINMCLLVTRRGLVWLAIRDEPERVAALTWSVRRERSIAYIGTAVLCALGGALEAAGNGSASSSAVLSFGVIIVPLLAVYVGGPGTVWGPLAGVVLLETFSSVATSNSQTESAAELAQIIQYAIALVVVFLLMYRQRKRRAAKMVRSESALTDENATPSGARRRVAAAIVGRGVSRPRVDIPASRNIRRHQPSGSPGELAVHNLAKSFGGVTVLRDVSFTVVPGEVLGVVGPNGAGKSTICNIIAGILPPDSGGVTLGGRAGDRLAPHQRARLGLGRSYQSPRVFPSLTLAENVAIAGGATGTREAAGLLEGLGVKRANKLGDVATLMERRMVEIARLAAMRPHWILLDEPLAGLAASEHDHILSLITTFAGQGAGVLVIEHLVPVIAPVTDRIVVLDGGRLIADGRPDQVLRQPEVVDAYLGAPVAVELSGSYSAEQAL